MTIITCLVLLEELAWDEAQAERGGVGPQEVAADDDEDDFQNTPNTPTQI